MASFLLSWPPGLYGAGIQVGGPLDTSGRDADQHLESIIRPCAMRWLIKMAFRR